MSVARAIQEAQEKGSFIRKMFEEGMALKKAFGADKVYDFSIGNPDVEPPAAFSATLARLAVDPTPGTHGYMPNPGFIDVRAKLAVKVNREQGVSCGPEHLIMSVGAAGGLNCVLKAIHNPGDEVVVPRPFFVEYGTYIANHGGKMVLVDSAPDFNLDVGAIAAALNEKTAAVLINSPHNPTGRIYPKETLAALADVLREHGKKCGRKPLLIGDEPYRELVYGGAVVPPLLASYEESLVVTSYSKSLSLPGERIGYIAVNPAMADAAALCGALAFATRTLGYVNAPALMQRVVAELVDERVAVEVYAARRAAFLEVLKAAGVGCIEPEGAFYLFCKVPARGSDGSTDDFAFVAALKEERILAVPGTGFGGPGYFRLAYCVDEAIIRASAAGFARAVAAWKA